MSIVKVIEVIASSEKSFDDAVQQAVKEASKTVSNIKSVYVKEMHANVDDNKVTSFAINAKVSFTITN
ncbi:dodecin family protein [Mesonia aquimarina]|uniref:dodecin family protein n=1 Tax=Mesonia aquimarina TaxID=1504967 RepID=UPI000EF5C893|nr:dodecin family protein [Mesonia aquimarina]